MHVLFLADNESRSCTALQSSCCYLEFMHPMVSLLRRHLSPKHKYALYNFYRRMTSVHRADGSPNVLLFTTPRSGSSWLMELIWSQPGFKCVNEPFDIRNPHVRANLGLSSWEALQSDAHQDDVARYMQAYLGNKEHAAEARPFSNAPYRFLTDRIVFKIIHTGENQINWFQENFNARVVFLTRHPIPVALSHQAFPRLEAYLNSDFSQHFNAAQLDLAARIIRSESKLQKGVLDWCFQNASPLRDRKDDWAVLSYEQLVLDPEPAIHDLAEKLELPDQARLYRQLGKSSQVKHKSDTETKKLLEAPDNESKRLRLVSKWRDKVSSEEAQDTMGILEAFGISAYHYDSLLPNQELWTGDQYAEWNEKLERLSLVSRPPASVHHLRPPRLEVHQHVLTDGVRRRKVRLPLSHRRDTLDKRD